jgi:hypothetical protein
MAIFEYESDPHLIVVFTAFTAVSPSSALPDIIANSADATGTVVPP